MKDLPNEKTLPNAVKYDEQITAVNDVTIGHKEVSQQLTGTTWDKGLNLYSITNLQWP